MGLVVAVAIITSLLSTPFIRKLAWRLNAVSHPDGGRKRHACPTALWGGAAVYLGATLGVAASYGPLPGTSNAMMLLGAIGLSTGILCLLGCYDDRYDMRAHWKLLGQVVSTVPVVLVGWHIEQIEILGQYMPLGWLGVPLVIGWLVLGINAMNLVDGMDGLAPTIGIVTSLIIVVIATGQGNAEVMLLGLALSGALAGFLVFNLPPARIYLGDCGSMVIGLAVSLLALQVSSGMSQTANITAASALLFVPLLDTALAIVRRLLRNEGIMKADRGHIHHRLLDRGFSIWAILGILGGLSLVGGIAAWLCVATGAEPWIWGGFVVLMICLVRSQIVGHEEWQLVRGRLAELAARLLGKPSVPRLASSTTPSLSSSASSVSTTPSVPGAELQHGGVARDREQAASAKEKMKSAA